ncbi:MAG: hypothetical protein R6X02_22975 [Enhygromyxa sp.]
MGWHGDRDRVELCSSGIVADAKPAADVVAQIKGNPERFRAPGEEAFDRPARAGKIGDRHDPGRGPRRQGLGRRVLASLGDAAV